MKKTTSDIGMNKTGIATSPIDSKEMVKGAQEGGFSSAGDDDSLMASKVASNRALPSETISAARASFESKW